MHAENYVRHSAATNDTGKGQKPRWIDACTRDMESGVEICFASGGNVLMNWR